MDENQMDDNRIGQKALNQNPLDEKVLDENWAKVSLYINLVWFSWHEWNGVEKDFENCRITVIAVGAYLVQLR